VDIELNELIRKVRNCQMTVAERESQDISFAYGNCRLENANITREIVAREAAKLGRDFCHEDEP